MDPGRIAEFMAAGAPVDAFGVGSHIAHAAPIDFTGDLKEVAGKPVAKRGRIPGITPNPLLAKVDLAQVQVARAPDRPAPRRFGR